MNMSISPFTRFTAKLFLFFVGILLLITLLLPTQVGVKTILKVAENFIDIEYAGVNGSLYSTLSIERLLIAYQDGDVEIDNLSIDLSLFRLFDLDMHINRASVDTLVVNQRSESKTEENKDTSSAYFVSPTDIGIEQFDVSNFTFIQNNVRKLSFTSLSVNTLALEESNLRVNDISFGTITVFSTEEEAEEKSPKDFENRMQDWLTMLEQPPSIQLPNVFIPLNIQLDRLFVGSVVQTKSQTPQQFTQQPTSNADSKSLMSELLVSVNIDQQVVTLSLSSFANALLTGTQVELDGSVDLSQNYAHRLSLLLVHNQQFLKGRFEGDVYKQQTVLEDGQNTLVDINIEAELDSQDFPLDIDLKANDVSSIFRFLNIDLPNAKIQSLAMTLNGDWRTGFIVISDGQLTYANSALNQSVSRLAEIAGKMVLKPSEYEIQIDDYSISGEVGRLTINGGSALTTATQDTQWTSQYSLNIDNFQANKLHQALPDLISGTLNLASDIKINSASGTLSCQNINVVIVSHKPVLQEPASKQLASKQLAVDCALTLAETGKLQVDNVSVSLGENTLKSEGHITFPESALWKYSEQWHAQTELALDIDTSATNLSQIIEGLEGGAELTTEIDGQLLEPDLVLRATAEDIDYNDMSVRQLRVDANTSGTNNWQGSLSLNAKDVSINNQVVQSTIVSLDGDIDKQNLKIDVIGEDWATNQHIKATLLDIESLHWEGMWEEGVVKYNDYALNKENDTAFSINLKEKLASLASHCWNEAKADAEICANTLEFKEDKLNFDTTVFVNVGVLLHEFEPELFRAGSELSLTSTVKGQHAMQDGIKLASANLMQGTLLTANHTLDVSAIVANINATQNEINTVMYAGTEETGRVGLSSKLKLTQGAYQHSGNLSINDLQLSLLQRFAPAINRLQGVINAGIKFEGDIAKPELFGDAVIKDGALTLDAYTYPLTEFAQNIVFESKTAKTEGSFKLGDGAADFSAQIDFDSNLAVTGDINGRGLEIAYQNFDLTTSPRIDFAMSPELIDVDGKIVIDATTIKIDSLPESLKSPSSDVIVIGQKPPEPLLPIALDINLNVLVDPTEKETIQIDAMGLRASLSGDLDLKVIQEPGSEENTYQPMQTFLNGYVNVLTGSYNAWGQALQIQSGSIYFNGEPSLPQFDISAIRNPLNVEGDVTVGIRATGNPILPKIELFSDPVMEQARQISYLLRGQDLSGGSEGTLNTSLINILVGFGVGRNENRVASLGKALGFDSLNVQAAGQGDSTQVQVTGRIADDLQITYAVGVFDAASEVILKYQLLPQLYIEATSGINNALDMFYEFSRGTMVSEVPVNE